ncbi:MAG: hypothetical protein IJN75_00970, partial [Clostridia bacterium]|nr:hypothetical protein [Clostridia bacterium]
GKPHFIEKPLTPITIYPPPPTSAPSPTLAPPPTSASPPTSPPPSTLPITLLLLPSSPFLPLAPLIPTHLAQLYRKKIDSTVSRVAFFSISPNPTQAPITSARLIVPLTILFPQKRYAHKGKALLYILNNELIIEKVILSAIMRS